MLFLSTFSPALLASLRPPLAFFHPPLTEQLFSSSTARTDQDRTGQAGSGCRCCASLHSNSDEIYYEIRTEDGCYFKRPLYYPLIKQRLTSGGLTELTSGTMCWPTCGSVQDLTHKPHTSSRTHHTLFKVYARAHSLFCPTHTHKHTQSLLDASCSPREMQQRA